MNKNKIAPDLHCEIEKILMLRAPSICGDKKNWKIKK